MSKLYCIRATVYSTEYYCIHKTVSETRVLEWLISGEILKCVSDGHSTISGEDKKKNTVNMD